MRFLFFSFLFLFLPRSYTRIGSRKETRRKKNYPFISAYFILSKEILGRRRAKNRSLRHREHFSRKERYSFFSANPLISLFLFLVRKFFFNRSDCDSEHFVFASPRLTKRGRREQRESEIFNLIFGCKIYSRSTHLPIRTILNKLSSDRTFLLIFPSIYLSNTFLKLNFI